MASDLFLLPRTRPRMAVRRDLGLAFHLGTVPLEGWGCCQKGGDGGLVDGEGQEVDHCWNLFGRCHLGQYELLYDLGDVELIQPLSRHSDPHHRHRLMGLRTTRLSQPQHRALQRLFQLVHLWS